MGDRVLPAKKGSEHSWAWVSVGSHQRVMDQDELCLRKGCLVIYSRRERRKTLDRGTLFCLVLFLKWFNSDKRSCSCRNRKG